MAHSVAGDTADWYLKLLFVSLALNISMVLCICSVGLFQLGRTWQSRKFHEKIQKIESVILSRTGDRFHLDVGCGAISGRKGVRSIQKCQLCG